MAKTKLKVWVHPCFRKDARFWEGANAIFPQIIRGILTEWALRIWYKRYLPKHFTGQAYYRYPYAYVRRTRMYNKRKRERKIKGSIGEVKPWVLSGRTRDTVLNSTPTIIKPKALRRVTIKVKLPFARITNFWAGAGRKHNYPKAMTAISTDEAESLRMYLERELPRRLGRAIEHAQAGIGASAARNVAA